jgi:chorismate synthase
MTGNEIGKSFRILTFGESHGKAVGVVIDGVKAGLEISEKDIQKELDKRKPGQSEVTTARKEEDKVEILSGVFKGKTLGTPICLLVRNKEARPEDYEKIKELFRPGHAGYTYFKKFGLRDYRGGGRSSGRETVGRVAAGALAKKLLTEKGIEIIAFTDEVAGIKAENIDFNQIENNALKTADAGKAEEMEKAILDAKAEGDSVGGIVKVVVKGLPVGIGEPVFGKLDAELAKALMSIPAVKGVEIGAGFAAAGKKGSQMNDEMVPGKGKAEFKSNNAGGVLGGISTGQDLVLRIAVKPTSSIALEQETVDEKMKSRKIKTEGRHDPCICPRIVPVAEAMVALTLQDLIQVQEAREKK